MLGCRILGHRPRFTADGPVLRWACERGCGAAGEKRYASAADAARYAEALDRRATRTFDRRTPYVGLFPLRIWYWVRTRRERRAAQDRAHEDGKGLHEPRSP